MMSIIMISTFPGDACCKDYSTLSLIHKSFFTYFADIDECSSDGLNTCDIDTRAMCTNTFGSFLCDCRSGFTGDGRTCTGRNLFLVIICAV